MRRRSWLRRLRRGSDAAFVEVAFRGVLNREPDALGLANHLDKLQAGVAREAVLAGVVASPEAARQLVYAPGLRALAGEFWRARQAADPTLRPVYFLHIMKTGGTALTDALVLMATAWPRLTDVFVDQLVCLPPPLLNQALLVTGHLPYEALDLLPPGGAVCTVLREPLARTLSHYGHINEARAAHGWGPPIPFDEFVSSAQWRPLWENYQARQLVHQVGLGAAWREFSPAQVAGTTTTARSPADAELPLQSLFDGGPLTTDPTRLLQVGLARLDTIELVGVSDDLAAVVARVAHLWHLPDTPRVRRLRVTERRLSADDLTKPVLAEVRAGTEVDAGLYDYARQRATADVVVDLRDFVFGERGARAQQEELR